MKFKSGLTVMDAQIITFREIRKTDNKELAELIRNVFREFKIDRPGTVYFDPTTDNLYDLFILDLSIDCKAAEWSRVRNISHTRLY
jgi:hypothetical protein